MEMPLYEGIMVSVRSLGLLDNMMLTWRKFSTFLETRRLNF